MDGAYIEETSSVEDVIIPVLRVEFDNSKKLLKETILQNNDEFNKRFLRLQFNTLQALIRNKAEFFITYPSFLLPLRGLVRFINEKLLITGMEQFTLNEDLIKATTEDNEKYEGNDDQIIDSIISYMKGKNEKRELILSSKDYELLFKYTSDLISQEKVPTIEKQLNPKLNNDVIRFTFWVLHRELYTTKKLRPYFYDFIKEVFLNFKNNEISSIRSQFGTSKRVFKFDFLPEIIIKHLEK